MNHTPRTDCEPRDPSGHVVGPEEAGRRLDAALAALAPDLGLRGRRRLIESGRVRVDDRPRTPGYRLASGQVITIAAETAASETLNIRLVAEGERYAALAKPAGLASARLAGGGAPSAEAQLAALIPGAVLVNRLDTATSGLLLAAFGPEAASDYRRLEDAGQVLKTYLAVVHGRLDTPLTIARTLDTANRRVTAVLPEDSPDPVRRTQVTPLAYDRERDLSLVTAVIRKGARHQIRAHLAGTGHPILGDALYGSPASARLHLHHARIELPGFTAEAPIEDTNWEGPRP